MVDFSPRGHHAAITTTTIAAPKITSKSVPNLKPSPNSMAGLHYEAPRYSRPLPNGHLLPLPIGPVSKMTSNCLYL